MRRALDAARTSRISRRSFLARAGVAAAGPAWLAAAASLRAADNGRRVVVVGGGIAGLAAAQRLRERGLETVLVEARNRLGGRIHTDRHGFDLGASWIHGRRGNPLVDLARSAGSPASAFDYDNHWRFDARGELSDAEDGRIDRDFAKLARRIAGEQRGAKRDAALGPAVVAELAGLDPSRRAGLRYAINTNITHEYAADPQNLSLAYFDADAELAGGDLLVPGGYSRLLGAFARPDALRLGESVRAIRWGGDRVVVETDKGRILAAAALVTLPLGVLKSGAVTFSPALPDTHRQAIARLGFGTLDKLVLRFPRIRWPREPHLFGFVGDGWWEEWVNLVPFSGEPVLVGFNAGDIARRSERMSDGKLARSALEVLRTLFGPSLPNPEVVVASRWASDPFARGAYSSYAPGSSPADRAALAAPISQRLILAGEACSKDHPATVHGAMQSGTAAAEALADLLAIRS